MIVICEECGKKSKLEFDFRINGWPLQNKPPKLRKRKQEKKDIKKSKESQETKESYVNNHGKN